MEKWPRRTNLPEREEIDEKDQAQKIQVFVEEDQKVSEEGSHSEDRGETEARRKEDSPGDWPGLKRRSREAYLFEDRARAHIAPRSPLRRAVSNEEIRKKAKKRAKSKTSSKRRVKSKTSLKRAGAKSKRRRATKAKRPTKATKSILPKASTVKRVAKEAAVAGGLAAVGTVLSALQPEEKAAEEAAGGGSETRNDPSKKRANP
jgi:hypothetical protein